MRQRFRLAALLLLPACASAPAPEAARPTPGHMLVYALPAQPNVGYAFGDSTWFTIRGGPIGEIRATINTSGAVDVAYAAKGADLEATIRVTSLRGAFTNSASGTTSNATEAGITGPAVVTVTSRGAPTVVTMPQLSQDVQRVGVSNSFFRRFFVRLPARELRPGGEWTDTVRSEDVSGGTKTALRDVVTSTFLRDTVISGRTLVVIGTSAQRELTISGKNEGMEILQKMTGSSTGMILWDAERKLLVERRERTELAGTFDLPQMGLTGLPLTAGGESRLVLK